MMHPATKKAIARRLNAAADILETRGWAKGYYAHDANGRDVEETSPEAVSFCALGALRRAVFEVDGPWYEDGSFYNPAYDFITEEFRTRFSEDIVVYNDEKAPNRRPIVKAFRRAAQRVLA